MGSRTFTLFVCLLIAFQVNAQTVDEIVEKHLAAIGGTKTLKKIDNITVAGTMTFSQGSDYREFIFTQIQTKSGKIYFQLMNSRGAVLNIRAYDGKTAWTGTNQKSQVIGGEEKKEFISTPFLSRFLERTIHAKQLRSNGVVAGDYWLSMKDFYDTPVTVKIDTATYQLVSESSRDYEGKRVSVELSNFKVIDGISFPMRIATRRDLDSDNDPKTSIGGEIQRIYQRINTVTVNSRIPASKFKRPEDR